MLNKANEKAIGVIRLEYERQGILVDNKLDECRNEIANFKLLVEKSKKEIEQEITELFFLTIAGQYCKICEIEGRPPGIITKTKDGKALYCTNKHKCEPPCKVWVNL